MEKTDPILLIEDDPLDQKAVQRAFRDLKIENPLLIAEDPIKGILCVKNKSDSLPCLIILDLKLPKMSGLEFLKMLKNDKQLKMIPVVVLSISQTLQDRTTCFELGAAGYVLKPLDYKKFVEVIHIIHQYWCLSLVPSSMEIVL